MCFHHIFIILPKSQEETYREGEWKKKFRSQEEMLFFLFLWFCCVWCIWQKMWVRVGFCGFYRKHFWITWKLNAKNIAARIWFAYKHANNNNNKSIHKSTHTQKPHEANIYLWSHETGDKSSLSISLHTLDLFILWKVCQHRINIGFQFDRNYLSCEHFWSGFYFGFGRESLCFSFKP